MITSVQDIDFNAADYCDPSAINNEGKKADGIVR
jgi:hypothetical protein